MEIKIKKGLRKWEEMKAVLSILIGNISNKVWSRIMKEDMTNTEIIMAICGYVEEKISVDFFNVIESIISEENIENVREWLLEMRAKGSHMILVL